MTTIANHVTKNFDGMLVFGDIHADYESFMRAHTFAKAHNLFFMSLGDLVDRGSFPFEVVSHMAAMMAAGEAGFVIGNHDDKFRRFYNGAKVSFSLDARHTLATVGPEKQDEFLKMYTGVVEMPVFSGYYHTFGDISVVHAACHPSIWENPGKIGDSARSRFLYGETNGEKHSDGYPVRLYNWIDDVPMGKTVIVGHDRVPINNVAITRPMVVNNNHGGKVIFTDTGCGKGGFLSGVVVMHNKGSFKVDRFVEFK